MKVILLSDIVNLGKKNEIVEVNDGYAKNFLIKTKKAVMFSPNSLLKLKKEIDTQSLVDEQIVNEAKFLKLKLETLNPIFHLKVNHGQTFGKISAKHLIDTINKDEKLINKFMLIEDHEWGIGTHDVKIKLHRDVIAVIKIKVLEQTNV